MDDRKSSLLVIACVVCFVCFVCGLGGCRPAVKSSTADKTETWAIQDSETTRLGELAFSIASEHDGKSGFLLLDDGQIAWITTTDGQVTTETETEPMTSKLRRKEADLLSVVPDDAQL